MHQLNLTLDCQGLDLRARLVEPDPPPTGARPVLVFLHEALGSIALWKDVPEQLARLSGCPALVYERFGHGSSAPLPEAARDFGYLAFEAWRVLPELLAQCRVERPVLVGHSDGATLALMYAARFPRQVTGVISEAAHLFSEEQTLTGIREARDSCESSHLLERLQRYHDNPGPIFHRWIDVWLAPENLSWSIERLMPRITCPVLAIQGGDDEYGTSRQVEAIVGGVSGPAQAVLIPGCRHVPHFQAQSTYLDAACAFIAGLPPNS